MEQNPSKMEIIKQDAVIVLKFDREFYARLTMLLQQVIENKTEEEMIAAAKQIEAKDIKDLWVLNYETLLYLLKASEEYCQQNGLTEMVDVSSMNPDNNTSSETPAQ